MQNEVMPVSGYRVTLTYNLHYRKHLEASIPATLVSLCAYPGLAETCQSFSALRKDPKFLPNGGLIGFGLSHRYPFDIKTELRQIYSNLRGPDALLNDICNELNIDVTLMALYHSDEETDFCLLDQFVSQWGLHTDLEEMLVHQLIRRYNAIY